MKNRLRIVRELRQLTQEQLAERAGTSQATIYKLETKQRMNEDWMLRLAPLLEVEPADLIGNGDRPISVPLAVTVGLAQSEMVDAPFDLPRPHERIPPPRRLSQSHDCLAVRIADDSADRMYPPESILFVRPVDRLDRPLRISDKVVVRRFIADRGDGRTMEILAGLLDRNSAGELVVLVRSNNRLAPDSVTVQRQTNGEDRFSDRHAEFVPAQIERDVPYRPADSDPAEILGLIVAATTPE